jgi:hypothetical protein
VLGSGLGPVRIDLAAGTATVTLDRSSLPTLLALSGTVFAIVLPTDLSVLPPTSPPITGTSFSTSISNPSLTTATLSPALASAAGGLSEGASGLSQTATFQTGSSLSLTLSPSTGNRVAATQSTANGGGEEEGGEDDVGPWWRMFRDLFASAEGAPAEAPVALAVAPAGSLSSGALDVLFSEAGDDGAAELDLPLPGQAGAPPAGEAPEDEPAGPPENTAWLLPLLALSACDLQVIGNNRDEAKFRLGSG